MPSLKYRRLRGDLIQTYKITKGADTTNSSILEFSHITNTRDSLLKLKKNFCKTKIRSNFLTNRIVNQWNKLSSTTKQADTLNRFKNLIDDELKHLRFDFDN